MASTSSGEAETKPQTQGRAGNENNDVRVGVVSKNATATDEVELVAATTTAPATAAEQDEIAEPEDVKTDAVMAEPTMTSSPPETSLDGPINIQRDNEDDKKPPAISMKPSYRFFAVRKCDGLQAPAIFLSLDDCNFYIDKEENDTPAVFQEFSSLEGAKNYIHNFIADDDDNDEDLATRMARKRTVVLAGGIATQRPQKARRRTKTPPRKDSLSGGQKEWLDKFDKMVQLAQDYKASHGDCNVPLKEEYGKLGFWVQKARYFLRPKLDGQASFLTMGQMNKLVDLGIVKSEEEQKLQLNMERQERKLEKHKKFLEDTWADMVQQIQEYKAETGYDEIPLTMPSPHKEKYVTLVKWLQKVRKYKKDYMEESANSSPLSEDQLLQLTELGVLASKSEKGKKAFNLSWPDMIKELTMFKEEFGHCEVPLRNNKAQCGRYENLSKWTSRLRTQMKNYEENPETSLLDEPKIAELRGIGFTFKYKRGVKGKNPQEELQDFEKYVEILRQVTEAKMPIKTNTRLQSWVAKQRKEYEEFKNNRPSTMDIHRVTRLTEVGFVFEAKKTQTWEERALNWFQYKTKHGTDPKRYSEDGLGKWVTEQRCKYSRSKRGMPTNLTEEQIKKLTEWGFSWEPKIKQPAVKASKAPWEERYQQLIQWKEVHGHCIVPQHYPVLGQWVHGQRSDYRKVQKGQKSPMTKEKIDKLEAIGFVFYTGRGGGVRTPESVARRLNQSTELEPDPFNAHPGVDPHIMHYYR